MLPERHSSPSVHGTRTRNGGLLPLIVPKRATVASALPKTVQGNLHDLNAGILNLLERRELSPTVDLEAVLTVDGPMRAARAPIHKFKPRRQAAVMTATSGYSAMKGIMFDFSEIEKMPAQMDLEELRQWEAEEEAQRAVVPRAPPQNVAPAVAAPQPPSIANRDDTRTYTELLDLYSLHEFIIRKGNALRNTPEFVSFKRHYAACWGNIETMIEQLEAFLSSYGVDLAYIDGKRLAEMAAFQAGRLLTARDLLECVANAEDVEPLLGDVSQQYHFGSRGHHLAAAKIQSLWRMYRQRIAYRHILIGSKAAVLIQRQWALHRAHCTTRRAIQTVRETRQSRWRQTMDNFTDQWPRLREGRRTVIHLPSLSYPPFHAKRVPYYTVQQLSQLTRLSDLADTRVDIVLLVPIKPEAAVLEYYYTLLEEVGVSNAAGRVTLLAPECAMRLPDGLSLTRLVYYSARVLRILGAICAGRAAYIVPGVIGPEELALVTYLNVPLLGPVPRIAQAFGTKSGCQRLLEAAEVSTPIGATQLRSREALLRALASLLLDHPDISRWLVKLETEAGSRGHAYLDARRMRSLKDGVPNGGLALFSSVLQELEEFGAKRVRLVHPECYADWSVYLNTFDVVGGCVEAVPNHQLCSVTASMFIEPNGEIHLQSIVEPMLAPAYTVLGCCHPPISEVPYEAVRDASLSIARAAFRKRIVGYLSVDYVVFENHTTTQDSASVRLWGVDVDLYLTNNASAHHFAILMSRSKTDSGPSLHASPSVFPQPSRWGSIEGIGLPASPTYAYSGVIYNPFISAIRQTAFFSLCRTRGIAYDRHHRRGIMFLLLDVLLRNCTAVLAVGEDMRKAAKYLAEFQRLLNLELPKQGEHSADSNFVYFLSIARQLGRAVAATGRTE